MNTVLKHAGLPVVMTEEKESVLVGSAILGAAASGDKVLKIFSCTL